MGIGLDDLFNKNTTTESEDTSSETALTIAPKSKPRKAKEDTSLKNICDEYKVLLYAIDTSGSMDGPIVSENVVDYDWPEDLKDHIRRVLSYASAGLSEEESELLALLDTADAEELKNTVLMLGPQNFSIYQKYSPTNSKMHLVRTNVKDLVDRRVEKFPDARLALMTFETEAVIEASTPDAIKLRLDALRPGGGTNITKAILEALDYFDKYPSPVGVHHIVLVSDGEDWGAMQIAELLPRMKERGVVLDYIYITSKVSNDKSVRSSVAQMFEKVCKELGGDYVEVSTASEFERKIITAANRLCLPPGTE